MADLWKKMGVAQRIATVALAALALIALIAFGGHTTSGSKASSPSSTSSFTPSSYSSSPSGSSGRSHASTPTNPLSPSPTDGLGSIPLATLPSQAQHTVELIDAGGPFPYSRDGIVYENRDHTLPVHVRGWYHEYTVPTPGASSRGVRRIVEGKDGTLYYTSNHYRSFDRVLR